MGQYPVLSEVLVRKGTELVWIQDIRASGVRLALHLLTIIALGTLLWEVLPVVAKLGFRTPSLVDTGVTRTGPYTTLTLEMMQRITKAIAMTLTTPNPCNHAASDSGRQQFCDEYGRHV